MGNHRPHDLGRDAVRTVTTVNSTYEINEADHMIRRLHGANDPTPRQGADGDWQEYQSIEPYFHGLLITWGADQDRSRCTWTSDAVSDSGNHAETA